MLTFFQKSYIKKSQVTKMYIPRKKKRKRMGCLHNTVVFLFWFDLFRFGLK